MSNTIKWDPSDDADIASYALESATTAQGPWLALATVAHVVPGPSYLAGPPAQFFYVDALGVLSTWYRLRAVDGAGSVSPWSYPFQIGQTSAALPTGALDIVQMALANIGDTTTVASLANPATKGERLGVLFYERTRDRLLRKVAPAWATRRAPLVQLTDHERAGWAYCYLLPSDLLRVLDLDLGYRGVAGVYAARPSPRFAVEANNLGTGRVLATDVGPDLSVVYVAQVVDPTAWSPDFTEAVTWALAAKLIMPMAVKADLAEKVVAMAKATLLEAIADDANDARLDPAPDSDIILARSW